MPANLAGHRQRRQTDAPVGWAEVELAGAIKPASVKSFCLLMQTGDEVMGAHVIDYIDLETTHQAPIPH
ncbi:hypothetical protein [Nocardia brasiliensis]|uniref:hypothetical protein n=1 Tax=Nocardia brasiliensis TaxID=37326 RepID=UPI0024537A15|nr:hypothetical protein [Nocardia brasiliensis]